MKKLVFPFVGIEVPDDFPDGFDLEGTFEYAMEHPEVAEHIDKEYRKAYAEWVKNGGICAEAKNQPEKAKARNQ